MFYMLKIYIYSAYVSKHNSIRKKQVILLMIPNGEGCKRSKSVKDVTLSPEDDNDDVIIFQ